MNISDVVIKKCIVISHDEFISNNFEPPNKRIMDRFTKKVLYVAYRLFDGDLSNIDAYQTGVVLSTHTGPIRSIKKIAHIICDKDYKGINPSLFPNVMLSTALAHLTMYLDIHGPSCVFYDTNKDARHALEYCIVQTKLGNCDGMVDIHVDENGTSMGRYILRKE